MAVLEDDAPLVVDDDERRVEPGALDGGRGALDSGGVAVDSGEVVGLGDGLQGCHGHEEGVRVGAAPRVDVGVDGAEEAGRGGLGRDDDGREAVPGRATAAGVAEREPDCDGGRYDEEERQPTPLFSVAEAMACGVPSGFHRFEYVAPEPR